MTSEQFQLLFDWLVQIEYQNRVILWQLSGGKTARPKQPRIPAWEELV
jgi:hypothetical protein